MSRTTCQWPVRNALGRYCYAIGYVARDTGGKAFCPHHIAEARRLGNPYPVQIERKSS